MPDETGTHEATGEGVTELVIALPHGSWSLFNSTLT